MSPSQMRAIKASSETSAPISERSAGIRTVCSFSFEVANTGSRVVRDELTVSPVATRLTLRREITNTHYRWVAQLWSIEECWVHAPKGTAQPEDSYTADCFWSRPSAAPRGSRVFPRFLCACHRVPPQLCWSIGKGRKESFTQRSIQSFASFAPSSFAVASPRRETTGFGELAPSATVWPGGWPGPHQAHNLTPNPAKRRGSRLTDSQSARDRISSVHSIFSTTYRVDVFRLCPKTCHRCS